MEDLLDLILLKDYNTRIVLFGILVYSVGSGLIGVFMLLQKRSMLADALSHATLPGIIITFIISIMLGSVSGKNIWLLLGGATVTTLISLGVIVVLQRSTFLKQDAILGIIISVFFGVGIVLIGLAQRMPSGNLSGIMFYIYGSLSSLQRIDAYLFLFSSIVIVLFALLNHRKLLILCFDPVYAKTIGIAVTRLDMLLLLLILLQTVVGIQAIGIILVSALMIIPPVSARFWSNNLLTIQIISISISIISGYVGGVLSALFAQFPAGAIIIAVAEVMFIASLFFGSKRGILKKMIEHVMFKRNIMNQHVLRTMYEYLESIGNNSTAGHVSIRIVHTSTGQSHQELTHIISRLVKEESVIQYLDVLCFTAAGLEQAKRIIRNHRLWEVYLLKHTDMSSEEVDYSADQIEHVLNPEIIAMLEKTMDNDTTIPTITSPHNISFSSLEKGGIE